MHKEGVAVEVIDRDNGRVRWTEVHKTEAEANQAIEEMKERNFNPDYFIFRKRKEVKQMNAAEARKLSEENLHKKAKAQLEKAIQELEEQIEYAAKDGCYQARIEVVCDIAWNECSNTIKLTHYFESKGFKVWVKSYVSPPNIKIFIVSWSEEK